jgi:integrase
MVSDKYVEQCLERMRVWMELRGLKPVTIEVYSRATRLLIAHAGKPLGAMRSDDVKEYLLELARRERSPRTRNVHLAAFKCALRATVKRDVSAGIPMAKVPRRSPEILSGTEVKRLLEATRSPKYRAIFMLAYGAGLRVGELSALETMDIDSERMLVHVRTGKTGPRYVMMSPRLLDALRAYWRAFRPSGPKLFPGRSSTRPASGLTRAAIHKVLRKAAAAAGITKRVSPHTLRPRDRAGDGAAARVQEARPEGPASRDRVGAETNE